MAQSLCTLKFNQFHESCNLYIVFCSFAFSQFVCELVVNGVRVLTTGTLYSEFDQFHESCALYILL